MAMIRECMPDDLATIRAIHDKSGLPENCFPEVQVKLGEEVVENPLFIVKSLYETQDGIALAAFLRVTSEVYLIVNHENGTPEERWQWLQELTVHIKHEAWKRGLDEMSCWIPKEIEKQFKKRLLDLGFVQSPWQSYTLQVR